MKYAALIFSVLFSVACLGQGQMYLQATAAGGSAGILDGYTGAGFAGAIDVLLYGSHSEVDNIAGSVTNGDTGQWTVTIRRDNDNAVRSFTATEVGDGTLTTWVGANNGYLRRWWDQSGNGNHANETDAADQVILVQSGVLLTKNSKPAFYVDAKVAGRHIIIPDLNATDITAFTVFSPETKLNATRDLVLSQWQAGTSSLKRKWISIFTYSTNNLSDAVLYATQQESRVNGAAPATINAYQSQVLQTLRYSGMTASESVVTLVGGLAVGAGTDIDPTDPFTGYFQALVLFPSNQTANISAIEGLINTEYSIYP